MMQIKCLTRRLLWLSAIAFSVMLASCQKTDETLGLLIRKNPVPAMAGDTFLEVVAAGTWQISVSYPDASQSDWLTFSNSTGVGSTSSIIVHFTDNLVENPRKAVITLQSGKQNKVLELTQQGKGGSHGGGQGKYGALSAPHSWMELPATDPNDGYEYFVHNMKVGSVSTRNYSFYWDYDHKVSLWVAYPLNPWNIGSYRKRSEAWGYDPLLPNDKQANVISTYGGGWTRGHQIASADRLGTYENNAMTYYSTNMTPQDFDFNGGIWADLEQKVRSLSKKSDTLYVVTGCALGNSPRTIRDKSGKTVAVPQAYYKALLFYSRKSSYAKYSGYSGCGVYMDHFSTPKDGSPKNYVMSIRTLEEKTGVNFFVNLPAAVGKDVAEQIEKQEPSWLPW